MNVNKLSNSFSVSSQIALEDIKFLGDLGYRSIIICRPDGEEGQPSFQEISVTAARIGIDVAYSPLPMGESPMEALPGFKMSMSKLKGPTLGYCKSGMRSCLLWALSQKGEQSADQIISSVQSAGFNIERLRPLLG